MGTHLSLSHWNDRCCRCGVCVDQKAAVVIGFFGEAGPGVKSWTSGKFDPFFDGQGAYTDRAILYCAPCYEKTIGKVIDMEVRRGRTSNS